MFHETTAEDGNVNQGSGNTVVPKGTSVTQVANDAMPQSERIVVSGSMGELGRMSGISELGDSPATSVLAL